MKQARILDSTGTFDRSSIPLSLKGGQYWRVCEKQPYWYYQVSTLLGGGRAFGWAGSKLAEVTSGGCFPSRVLWRSVTSYSIARAMYFLTGLSVNLSPKYSVLSLVAARKMIDFALIRWLRSVNTFRSECRIVQGKIHGFMAWDCHVGPAIKQAVIGAGPGSRYHS